MIAAIVTDYLSFTTKSSNSSREPQGV